VKEEFQARDLDGNGKLSVDELRPIILKLGLKSSTKAMQKWCKDGSKELGFEEYIKLLFDVKYRGGKDVGLSPPPKIVNLSGRS